MKKHISSVFCLLIILLFSFWTIKPLFQPGFFPMHDDTQPARVYEMAKALSYGQFPVRWVQDLGYGYGYPLFNFYAPLPYYIGAAFNLLGFDPLVATKIMFLLGIILAAVTMFFLLNNLVGEPGALAGSLLYMYAPYHAINIYVRGAVGELYAMAFLPMVLLGINKIISQRSPGRSPSGHLPGVTKLLLEGVFRKRQGIVLGALGFAGVLLSHNILGMITGFFLFLGLLIYLIYLLISHKKLFVICYLLFVILLGFGLSSFFVLPAIFEKDFTRVNELVIGSSNFSNHFVYLDQLWSSPWGYAGSAPGRLDGMSFMIGKIHLLLGFLSIPIVLIFHKRKKIKIFISMLVLFLISVFFMLEQSKFIWEMLPGFAFIQYPWRFLVYTTLSLSIMISIMFVFFHRIAKIILGVFLIAITIWFNSKYFIPKEYLSLKAEDYTSGLNLRFKISKISDEYLPHDFVVPKSTQDLAWQAVAASPDLEIEEFAEYPTKKTYNIYAKNAGSIETNITYFPGWQAKIDGKIAYIKSKNGRITLFMPQGQHSVEFIFKDTPIRFLANAISILALFLVVYIIVF